MDIKYILIVVVLLAISGALLWQYLHPEKSTIQSESSNFSIEDTGSIVKIFIYNYICDNLFIYYLQPKIVIIMDTTLFKNIIKQESLDAKAVVKVI